MDDRIPRAIFATNLFATRYPEEHKTQWRQYEEEISDEDRNGYFGKENISYIRYLMNKKNHFFLDMTEKELDMISFER